MNTSPVECGERALRTSNIERIFSGTAWVLPLHERDARAYIILRRPCSRADK
jgi:hypothetical protein